MGGRGAAAGSELAAVERRVRGGVGTGLEEEAGGLGLGLGRERLEERDGEVVEEDEASARLRLRVSIQRERGEGRRPPRSGGGDAARKGWVAEEGASGVRRSKIWVGRESR
jgi:hypothetical protein